MYAAVSSSAMTGIASLAIDASFSSSHLFVADLREWTKVKPLRSAIDGGTERIVGLPGLVRLRQLMSSPRQRRMGVKAALDQMASSLLVTPRTSRPAAVFKS